MMTAVESQVKDILLRMLDVDEDRIVPTALIREDLGATSIDLLEFISTLEKEFDLNIDDEDIPKLTSIQATVDYLNSHKS